MIRHVLSVSVCLFQSESKTPQKALKKASVKVMDRSVAEDGDISDCVNSILDRVETLLLPLRPPEESPASLQTAALVGLGANAALDSSAFASLNGAATPTACTHKNTAVPHLEEFAEMPTKDTDDHSSDADTTHSELPLSCPQLKREGANILASADKARLSVFFDDTPLATQGRWTRPSNKKSQQQMEIPAKYVRHTSDEGQLEGHAMPSLAGDCNITNKQDIASSAGEICLLPYSGGIGQFSDEVSITEDGAVVHSKASECLMLQAANAVLDGLREMNGSEDFTSTQPTLLCQQQTENTVSYTPSKELSSLGAEGVHTKIGVMGISQTRNLQLNTDSDVMDACQKLESSHQNDENNPEASPSPNRREENAGTACLEDWASEIMDIESESTRASDNDENLDKANNQVPLNVKEAEVGTAAAAKTSGIGTAPRRAAAEDAGPEDAGFEEEGTASLQREPTPGVPTSGCQPINPIAHKSTPEPVKGQLTMGLICPIPNETAFGSCTLPAEEELTFYPTAVADDHSVPTLLVEVGNDLANRAAEDNSLYEDEGNLSGKSLTVG
ncbi:hypothetical protein BaRGS_00015890 [Batillaria attramentaria]|uniref:Uncharacterized protein n=1 Tax=Batillaria attramentaria TaxID=370345 RepID=A0ABD0L0X6_9CAEN